MEPADAWHMTDQLDAEQGKGDPFAAAVRATRMAMIITNPRQHDNPIVFVNEAFLRLSGYERHEIMGQNCRFLQGPDTDRGAVTQVREAVENNRDIAIDLLNYRKDGTPFWNALYLSPVINEAGETVFFFASTWGPAAWVVIGEIFQLPIRAKGVALSTASNWFWNCIIAIIVPYMTDFGEGNLRGKVFFVWGKSNPVYT